MENKLIHLISELDSLRKEYFDTIKIIDLKGYTDYRAVEISKALNQICLRMLVVQSEIRMIVQKVMKDNTDLQKRYSKKLMPSRQNVIETLKGNR